MIKRVDFSLVLILVILSFSIVSAEYSIDISGLKSEEYSIGEEVRFEVILLDGDSLVEEIVQIKASDTLEKKIVEKEVSSNKEETILIGSDYPSGLWSITATIGELTVERSFNIQSNQEVQFELVGDELIIRNVGNSRYTKTVEIDINGVKNSYAQNIGISEEKVLRLISAEGDYDVTITDGTTTISRKNIHISGGMTGNVIGAVDKDLVEYTGLASVSDSGSSGRFVSLNKLPLALTFVAGVFVLGALVLFERKLTKKKKIRL